MSKFKVGDLIKYQKNGMTIYKVIRRIEEDKLWGIIADNPKDAIEVYKDCPIGEVDSYFPKEVYKYITIINGYNTPLYKTMHQRSENGND